MLRLCLLMVVTVGMYSGLWSAGFVWDDIPLIVQNQALADGSIRDLFTSDLWADSGAGDVSSGYFRPLVLLSFAVDRLLFDLNPLGYHLHSLTWHLIAVLGLFRLCRPIMSDDGAFMAATFFAVHPAQSEVVSWVSARNDLMAAALGFLALSMVWSGDRPTLQRWLVAFGLSVMACLSKETAFVLPVLLLTADLARDQMHGMWRRVAAPSLAVAVVIAVRAWLGVGEATLPSAEGWLLLKDSILHWAGIMGATVVSPWPLSSARDLSWVSLEPMSRVWLGVLFWVLVAYITFVAKGARRRLVCVGLIWVVVLLGITLVPTADKGGFGDRFLYWPMAGIAVVVGTVCAAWWRLFVPVLVVSAAIIVHLRLPDWAHDRALWGAGMRDVPTPTNELSLGHALTLHSRHKRAHVNFVSAIAGENIDIEACAPIVGSAMRAGLNEHAFRMGLWAIGRGCPKTGTFHGWMATAAAMNQDWRNAAVWAETGPTDPKGRARVVQAALALRAGDDARYREIEKAWAGERALDVQVGALLQPPPIVRDLLEPPNPMWKVLPLNVCDEETLMADQKQRHRPG